MCIVTNGSKSYIFALLEGDWEEERENQDSNKSPCFIFDFVLAMQT